MMIFIIVLLEAFTYFVFSKNQNMMLNSGQLGAITLIKTFDTGIDENTSVQQIQNVLNQLANQETDIKELSIYSLGDNSSVIASLNKGDIGQKSDLEDLAAARADKIVSIFAGGVLDITAPLYDNQGKIDYVAGVKVSLDQEFSEIKALVLKLVISGLIALLVCFIVFSQTLRLMISKPLVNVMDAAQQLPSGKPEFQTTKIRY
jgi:hypothetical protein